MNIFELKNDSSPVAMGKRIKFIRNMAAITAKELADFCNIGYSTLKHWETSKFHKLSTKGARLIVDAMKNQGIECDIRWLMHGKGKEPVYIIDKKTPINITESIRQEVYKDAEINLFKSINPLAITITIDINAEPFFKQGDIVGGIYLKSYESKKSIGKSCIFLLEDETTFVGHVVNILDENSLEVIPIESYKKFDETKPVPIKTKKIAPIQRAWIKKLD